MTPAGGNFSTDRRKVAYKIGFGHMGLLTKYCKSQRHMVKFNRVMLNDDQKS